MSDPALPSFPIDVFVKLPASERPPYATLGRVYDLDARCAGSATWDSMVGVVFTPDGHKPLAAFFSGLADGLTRVGDLDVAGRRFVALDDPRLYVAMQTAFIRGNPFDAFVAITFVRRELKIGLAEAKGLVEAVLAEGIDRGPIASVSLVDGRLAVERETDVQRAEDVESTFRFRDLDLLPGSTLHIITGKTETKSRMLEPRDYTDHPPGPVMSPEDRAKLDEAVAEFRARPEVQERIRAVTIDRPFGMSIGMGQSLIQPWPAPPMLDAGPMRPIPTYADLVLSPNRSESSGPLRMETLKARANPGALVSSMELFNWSLDPTAEKHEKPRQVEVAGGFDPSEQIRTANARADRLQAVLDAETGQKGLEGWIFQSSEGVHAWTFERDEINLAVVHLRLSANGSMDVTSVFFIESNLTIVRDPSDWSCIHFQANDALDGMEKATALLREYGVLPEIATDPDPAPSS